MTTDYFGDRWLSGSPTYLTDLNRCQPYSALYPGAKARHWRMHTYETDTLSGVMLRADTETDAPEVTYPFDVSGWHAVSIGMKGDSAFQIGHRVEGLARLSGDDTFSLLSLPLGARPERQADPRALLEDSGPDRPGHRLRPAQGAYWPG